MTASCVASGWVLGTAARFLGGGGILVHGIGPLHHGLAHALQGMNGLLQALLENVANMGVGLVAGALVLAVVTLFGKLRGQKPA